AAGGFGNGKIGGAANGDAVLITPGGCHPPKAPPPPKPERVKASGAITAVPTASPGSITVAGVTCGVPANLQNDVSKLKVGDVVTIECDVANGTSTLRSVSGHGHEHGHHK